MKISISVGALSLVIGMACLAQTESPLETNKQKTSYGFGLQMGGSLASQAVEIDVDAVMLGIQDAVTGAAPRVTTDELRAAMTAYQQEIAAERVQKGEKNRAAGEAFLASNRAAEGVVELESGLQYKELSAGAGDSPSGADTVVVHYRGTLIDGTEFDSSYRRGQPATFGVGQVIRGWTEALGLMKPGDKWMVYLPPNLAYGETGAGPRIGPNEVLVFEIELLEIKRP